MFVVAMSTIAKLWKELNYPSGYTHTHTHTHNGILAIRNDKYPPFASTWIELEGIIE